MLVVFELLAKEVDKIVFFPNDSIINMSANDANIALEGFCIAREQLVDCAVIGYTIDGCYDPYIVARLDEFVRKLDAGLIRVRDS